VKTAFEQLKRRDFILALAGAAAWPLLATSSAGQYAAGDPGYRMREALRDVGLGDGRDIVRPQAASH
jgi:hypothetical protein